MAENQQVLTIARMRAEAEDIYGTRLGEIGSATDRITGGFSRDDGASVRKVRTTWAVSWPKLTAIGLRWSTNGNGGSVEEPQENRTKHSRSRRRTILTMV